MLGGANSGARPAELKEGVAIFTWNQTRSFKLFNRSSFQEVDGLVCLFCVVALIQQPTEERKERWAFTSRPSTRRGDAPLN